MNKTETIDQMVAARKFQFELDGEVLNEAKPTRLFYKFQELREAADELWIQGDQEAKEKGIAFEETNQSKEIMRVASLRNATAKAFLEKCAWDDVSIRSEYGEDVEKDILKSGGEVQQADSRLQGAE